jgi:formate hydrogenlyase subunit 3/multisubunit Na+/H+ antiporter MnhD subunit
VREETVISLPVPEGALWAALGVTAALFMIVSAIIHHHWSYYGLRESERAGAAATYYVVSGILLVGMVVSALAYGAFR